MTEPKMFLQAASLPRSSQAETAPDTFELNFIKERKFSYG